MWIIGLTGAVATGKSTITKMLRHLGYPVFDADEFVAQLYREDNLLQRRIAQSFPDVIDSAGTINKSRLAAQIFADSTLRRRLEAWIHPQVRQAAQDFAIRQRPARCSLVFWEIPLLFELGMDQYCDEIWVVWCGKHLQRRRALRRFGWDLSRLQAILAVQWPIRRQMRAADRVFSTGAGRGTTIRRLKRVLGYSSHF